jgi:hypothetical protein
MKGIIIIMRALFVLAETFLQKPEIAPGRTLPSPSIRQLTHTVKPCQKPWRFFYTQLHLPKVPNENSDFQREAEKSA